MGRVEGKVAFITGAARGQGRSHAVRLAEEGADIIAIDIDRQVKSSIVPTATAEDLAETVKLVEDYGRRIISRTVDVRDLPGLQAVIADAVGELGRLDIICANAGIASSGGTIEMDESIWQEMIDINLTGVWKTVRASVPAMIQAGNGGAVILTSSVAGVEAYPSLGHYVAAKHGVIGLMRTLTIELAPYGIRANAICPTSVDTPMVMHPRARSFLTGIENATWEDVGAVLQPMHALEVPGVHAEDISNIVLFLASDEARYITGTAQLVDAGATSPFKIPHA